MTRLAATLVMMCARPSGLEVLMARRNAGASFAGGLWVFPGGAVDPIDESELAKRLLGSAANLDDSPLVSAAFRETAEEINAYVTSPPPTAHVRKDLDRLEGADLLRAIDAAGLVFDIERCAYWANWITPRARPKRFDTHFYVVEVEPDLPFEADDSEIVDVAWITPSDALDGRTTTHRMMFPTIRNLARLSKLETPGDVLATARTTPVDPIEPAPIFDERGGIKKLLIPGDAGYEDLLAQQVPYGVA